MTEPADTRFRALFERELAFVCRMLEQLGVHKRDVPDIAQELFLTVHAQLREHPELHETRKWLYAFCVRYSANYRRLARHRERMKNATETQADLDSERVAVPGAQRTSDKAAAVAAKDLVLRCLDVLDETQREAIVLHDLEGMPAPEIAAMVGAPLNTIYSRVRLARQAFKARFIELEGAPT
jgi:RNA polymerase sigma-70 factor, ECF subfamily